MGRCSVTGPWCRISTGGVIIIILKITNNRGLCRWWFLSKCSKGRMSVVSRSWSEVTSDERYRAAVRAGAI